jgi:hypothetical protein
MKFYPKQALAGARMAYGPTENTVCWNQEIYGTLNQMLGEADDYVGLLLKNGPKQGKSKFFNCYSFFLFKLVRNMRSLQDNIVSRPI